MILGIIPARGGSVRLPGKNTKMLAGWPMIHWTIEAALSCHVLDRVVLSTDDPMIEMCAQNNGVEVLMRPKWTSSVDSIYDEIFRVLDEIPAEWVVLLQPTSPLRISDDIDGAVRLAQNEAAPSCVSCEHLCPVPNGAVYVAYTSWLREHRNFDGPRTVTYQMPTNRSVDVDTIKDFERAEALLIAREAR